MPQDLNSFIVWDVVAYSLVFPVYSTVSSLGFSHYISVLKRTKGKRLVHKTLNKQVFFSMSFAVSVFSSRSHVCSQFAVQKEVSCDAAELQDCSAAEGAEE